MYNIDKLNKNLVAAKLNKKTFIRFLGEASANALVQMMKSLQEIYPDNWDLQVNFNLREEYTEVKNKYGYVFMRSFYGKQIVDDSSLNYMYRVHSGSRLSMKVEGIIIRYPELLISNSRKESLTIKDLFVLIPITTYKNGVIEFERPSGLRTTITQAEFLTNYAHSHLRAISYDNCHKTKSKIEFGNFCIGTGDIVAVISLINSESFDIDLFNLYIHTVDTYVRWESIEGGPHIRMRDTIIKGYDIPPIDKNVVLSYNIVFRNYIISGGSLELDWKIVDGEYRVVDNDKLEHILRQPYIGLNTDLLLSKDESGKYFVEKRGIPNTNILNAYIYFRGQKINLKIEGELKKSNSLITTKYVHPKIKKYVTRKLEYYANKTILERNKLNRFDTLIYT